MKSYAADFETTTTAENCHVWAFGICEVGQDKDVFIGYTIDEFMKWCEFIAGNDRVYFHNLKFDAQFIISWLLKNGFTHSTTPAERKTRTFNTLISDKGFYYSIEIIFKLKNKTVNKIVIRDSMKLIPLSVKEIAETFDLPYKKLEIDYSAHDNMPEGSKITAEEKEYLEHDVKIVAHALNFFFSKGLDRLTIGSCALEEYKTLISKKKFERFFPPPTYHEDVSQSYRGGWTYLNPKYEGKTVENGIVLDVNSLYPAVMRHCLLPYGTPIFFKGKYKSDNLYPLYTQMFQCQFELKPGKLPTVQIKHSMFFKGNEYLTSSDDEIVVMCMNSVDFDLFLENYNVYNLEFLSGWKFKATHGLFDAYVDKWSAIKIQAKEENNQGMYLIAKLFLNSLYGKFGTGIYFKSKIPYLDKKGVVHYKDSAPEYREGIYIAMASFITSYARDITIRAAQKITDDFNSGKSNIEYVYGDTDSLHIISPDGELPEGLEINDSKLGAWKVESLFKKAKYLRQKCYIALLRISEDEYTKGLNGEKPFLYSQDDDGFYKLKITVAGMPSECYEEVTFENFEIGSTYKGKLKPEIVPGGVILKDIDFTIQS